MLSMRKGYMDMKGKPFFRWTGSRSNWQASPPECWWLEAEAFPCQPPKSLKLWPPWPPPIQRIITSSRASSFLYLQTIINWKYWVCQSITCSAQRQVHLLPRYSHQTRRSPPVSLGLGGLLLCCQVAPILCEYSSTISKSRASSNFWSADYMAINLLKSATTNHYATF